MGEQWKDAPDAPGFYVVRFADGSTEVARVDMPGDRDEWWCASVTDGSRICCSDNVRVRWFRLREVWNG